MDRTNNVHQAPGGRIAQGMAPNYYRSGQDSLLSLLARSYPPQPPMRDVDDTEALGDNSISSLIEDDDTPQRDHYSTRKEWLLAVLDASLKILEDDFALDGEPIPQQP